MEENQSWERDTINKMLEMSVKEQRAKRRWGIFFKSIVIAYILTITIMILVPDTDSVVTPKTYTAVIPIVGEISAGRDASGDNLIPLLRKAFKTSAAKAVMLRIDSPGGSPVQASQISNEIKRLKVEFPDKKVYAVIEDVGASAAYWIATFADEIYADQASLVGSIGVAMSSFGFVDTMNKLGVERRLYIAGYNKDMLDPFSPTKPDQVAMLQKELDILHKVFIDVVKQNRGARLKESPDMFSGRVWVGIEAKPLGIIDGFGDQYTVAKEIIGAPELVEFEIHKSFLTKLTDKMGSSLHQAMSKFNLI